MSARHPPSLPTERAPGRRLQAGFSLIEMAVVIALVGLLTAGVIELVTGFTERQAMRVTTERLETLGDALVLFASRQGYLPCPADAAPADLDDDGAARSEDADNVDCTSGRDMVGVPWRDLGIPREITFDGWGRRFTYVVYDGASGLTRGEATGVLGLDMLDCSCPGPDCIDDPDVAAPNDGDDGNPMASCLADDPADEESLADHVREFLRDKGLELRTDPSDPASAFQDPAAGTGAAFVLISHGANGDGAFGPAALTAEPPAARTFEKANATFDGIYVSTTQNTREGNAYFDDLVHARRIDEVAEQAGRYLRD